MASVAKSAVGQLVVRQQITCQTLPLVQAVLGDVSLENVLQWAQRPTRLQRRQRPTQPQRRRRLLQLHLRCNQRCLVDARIVPYPAIGTVEGVQDLVHALAWRSCAPARQVRLLTLCVKRAHVLVMLAAPPRLLRLQILLQLQLQTPHQVLLRLQLQVRPQILLPLRLQVQLQILLPLQLQIQLQILLSLQPLSQLRHLLKLRLLIQLRHLLQLQLQIRLPIQLPLQL